MKSSHKDCKFWAIMGVIFVVTGYIFKVFENVGRKAIGGK